MSLERAGQRAMQIRAEQKARAQEALALYRPLPNQEPFFRSLASERLVRGGNRSGKTLSAACEFASAATGVPIIGTNGELVPMKFPVDRPLTLWVFGWDQDHIGRVIHSLLFKTGAFKIIKDAQTRMWRPYQPWDPLDLAREKEARPAPPLIPKRFIEEFSWENKAQRVFTSCRLKSRWPDYEYGTIIHAFSSKGAVKAGESTDLIWIDENIEDESWIAELQARLSDRKGRLIWSSLPYMTNSALMDMSERAEAQAERENPDVEEFRLRFADNEFIDADEKRKRIAGWSDEERRVRDDGDFVADSITMYPEFDRHTHCCPARAEAQDDKVDAAVRANDYQIPDDWCCFLALDPGHARPAVVLAAVPPPNLGDAVVVFEEVCPTRVDAHDLAQMVKARARDRAFEAFVVDPFAGRTTPMGQGLQIEAHYAEAFRQVGLRCRQTQHYFQRGSTHVPASLALTREAMTRKTDGRPVLRVLQATPRKGLWETRCPNLVKQIEKYRKKVAAKGGVVHDEPAPHQKDDLVDALRYLIAFGPEYRQPEKVQLGGRAWRPFQRLVKEERGKPTGTVNMGPAA